MRLRIFKSVAVFLTAYILFGHLYIYWTGDFREGNILQEGPRVDLLTEQKDITPILSQTFYYLNKGNQTYALISSDEKYVLKLFKRQTLKRTPFSNVFPAVFPWKSFMLRTRDEELKKRDRIFVGYRLAYEMDRENTGLVYLSFGHSSSPLPPVTIKDSLGVIRVLDLTTTPFVIQRNAKTTRKILRELHDRGDTVGIQEKKNQLYSLYISEYKKGLVDNDHNVLDNTGFVDDRPIRLDVGKLVYDPTYKNPEVYEKDLEKVKKRLEAF